MHKVLVFAFGVIIGVCVDEFFLKDIKKKETKEDDRVMTKAPEEFKYTEDDFNKAVDKAEKIMNEEHYIFEEKEEEALPVVDYFRELEIKLQTELSRKVKIDGKGRKKTLTLCYVCFHPPIVLLDFLSCLAKSSDQKCT